jgi:hypothetical protein
MGVIWRWECRDCGRDLDNPARPGFCADPDCDGEMVEREYVRRERLQGAIQEIDEERADLQRAIRKDGLGSDMRDIGQLEGLERALFILRRGQ